MSRPVLPSSQPYGGKGKGGKFTGRPQWTPGDKLFNSMVLHNEVNFKKKRAIEKSSERQCKRNLDENNFKKDRAIEKSRERQCKRNLDENSFKKTRTSEKSRERGIKRKINEDDFKKMMK